MSEQQKVSYVKLINCIKCYEKNCNINITVWSEGSDPEQIVSDPQQGKAFILLTNQIFFSYKLKHGYLYYLNLMSLIYFRIYLYIGSKSHTGISPPMIYFLSSQDMPIFTTPAPFSPWILPSCVYLILLTSVFSFSFLFLPLSFIFLFPVFIYFPPNDIGWWTTPLPSRIFPAIIREIVIYEISPELWIQIFFTDPTPTIMSPLAPVPRYCLNLILPFSLSGEVPITIENLF